MAERAVVRKLVELGLEPYAPEMKRCKPVNGRMLCRMVPVIPGYVFVRLEPSARNFNAGATAKGVVGFLPLGRETPAALPDGAVEVFRSAVEAGADDRAVDDWLARLAVGSEVEITSGPLASPSQFARRVGKFLGRNRGRVVLLLEFFNRLEKQEIPAHQVSPLGGV